MTHQYSRAERLLTRPFPTSPPKRPVSPSPVLNGHPHSSKGKGREYDASQLMLSMPRLPMGPGGMIELPEEMQDRVSRLVDMSVACRYLAALCQVCPFSLVDSVISLYIHCRSDKENGMMQWKCLETRTLFRGQVRFL